MLGKGESEEGESPKEGRTKQHLSKKKSWFIIKPTYTTVSIQGKLLEICDFLFCGLKTKQKE